MFVVAVVWFVRNFVKGDRRMRVAAIWTGLTAMCGVISFLSVHKVAQSLVGFTELGVYLSMVPILGCALWVAIGTGILLGDRQGGYWRKKGGVDSNRSMITWCVISLGVAIAIPYIVGHLANVPLGRAHAWPPKAVLQVSLSLVTYSLAEEFLYRGCFQALITSWFKSAWYAGWLANGIAAVLFMGQHVSQDHQYYRFIITLPAGLLFGVIFARFGILAAIAVHLAADLALTFVMPILF